MKVAMCLSKDTIRARYLMECFEQGLGEHGDEAVWINDAKDVRKLMHRCDVAFQVCTANKHHRNIGAGQMRRLVASECERLGMRLLILDTGFIRNQSEMEMRVDAEAGEHKPIFLLDDLSTYDAVLSDIYYEIGYDGLKREADYLNADSPPDRWDRLGKLLMPWKRRRNGYVLILGQTVNGASSQSIDVHEWCFDQMRAIRKVTDREIVWRVHPRTFKRKDARMRKELARTEKIFRKLGNVRMSDQWLTSRDLDGASVAVGYSSNATVAAALDGVPVFVGSDICMAWDVANHDISRVEDPEFPDRTQWAWNLAYAQWNCAEMKSGEAWNHLRRGAIKSSS